MDGKRSVTQSCRAHAWPPWYGVVARFRCPASTGFSSRSIRRRRWLPGRRGSSAACGPRAYRRQGGADLEQLHDTLAERLDPIGFPPEGRAFLPYLTLGRFRGRGQAGGAALADAIAAEGDVEAGEMRVQRIVLSESRLSKAGAEHDRLHVAELGSG